MEQLKLIRHQHGVIFNSFSVLKYLIKNHINDENALLDNHNELKPDTHIDVFDKIRIHKEKHEEFLQTIIEIEKELDKHIKLYDSIHIHKL